LINVQAHTNSFLSVPGSNPPSMHHHSNSLPNAPNFDFVVTPDDQSSPIDMNSFTNATIPVSANANENQQIPWFIDSNIPYQSQTVSVSSSPSFSSPSFLSPGSPYASSIMSSTSSMDDGSWGPPSPSYYSNEAFLEAGAGPENGTGTSNLDFSGNNHIVENRGRGTSTVSIGQPTNHALGLPNQIYYQT